MTAGRRRFRPGRWERTRRLRGGGDGASHGGAVPPSRISAADLADEALAGLFARPGRTILTVLATVVGLAALVATLGLTRTASNRIVGRFDELAATQIIVSSKPAIQDAPTNELPWDSPARMRRLNGVVAAGNLSKVDVHGALVTTSPVTDPQGQTGVKLGVQAASPDLFPAIRAQLGAGRLITHGQSRRADRVVVLGTNAAVRLGITRLDRLPAIRIGDELFLVVGILDDVARQHELLSAAIIPEGTARSLYGRQSPETVVIETRIGATRLISEQAALALRPDRPDGLKVAAPAEQRRVRDRVERDLSLLFVMLGGVSLLVGAIGIANVTLVSVMERTGEIGLRRALGATRRHIGLQFLLESSVIGFAGGVAGASLGVLIVVGVSAAQTWTPVLDPVTPFVIPLVGAVTGLLAGSYPALRAARMEPVEALQSGT
jgi:macrolide transport system ATP-binding/permease protein